MTEYDQRIALAEFEGWTKCRVVIKGAGGCDRDGSPHGMPPGKNYEAPLPDYLHDLNAMHRVEHKLDELQRQAYVTFLTSRMWLPDGDITTGACFQALHADAAQRAEALLRTIGKWTE